ncbi:MAG: hypothetical protein ACI9R3_005211 [Verrucomicrobiales bacterium]|jgi:hypothetical protein
MEKSNKWKLILVVGVLLIACAILRYTQYSSSSSGSSKTALANGSVKSQPLPESVKTQPKTTKEKEVPAKRTGPPLISPFYYEARDWLNSYCPVLTEQEEDLLLERHQRSPQTLVALAMLTSGRTEEFLIEALEKAPDDPLVIAAALKHRKALGLGKEELLESYKLAAPDDAFPDIMLASEVWASGDREKAAAYLKEAYGKNSYGDLPDLVETQASLLQEVGRSKEQALSRALVSKSDLADPGTIFANALSLEKIETLSSQDAELGLLLLDLSQRLSISDDVPLWQRDFYLDQEEGLYRKFSGIEDLEQVFDEDPKRLVQAAKVEREAIAPFTQASKAIVPILQRLSDEDRRQFVEIASGVSEQSALQWLARQEPGVFDEIENLASEPHSAWPGGGIFWGTSEKNP